MTYMNLRKKKTTSMSSRDVRREQAKINTVPGWKRVIAGKQHLVMKKGITITSSHPATTNFSIDTSVLDIWLQIMSFELMDHLLESNKLKNPESFMFTNGRGRMMRLRITRKKLLYFQAARVYGHS